MNNKKTIWDYFDDFVDYPKDIASNPIPIGTCYNYVSSTFLNGFINYVYPILYLVLDRYCETEEEINRKNKLIDDILSGEKSEYHTDLSKFGDDVLILARIPEENNKYMLFYFDQDSSDCNIGRFETDDPVEDIIQTTRNTFNNGCRELPIKALTGWIKF